MENVLTKTSQVFLKCVSCGSSSNFNTLEDGRIQCECGKEYSNKKELQESNPENIELINAEMEKLKTEGVEEIKEKIADDLFETLQNTFKGNKYITVSRK